MAEPESPLRHLPPFAAVAETPAAVEAVAVHGAAAVHRWIRLALADLREHLRLGPDVNVDRPTLLARAVSAVRQRAAAAELTAVGPIVNATGVVLHTNLGRAPLCERAMRAVAAATQYANVEMALDDGERSRRGHQLDEYWPLLTGGEAAFLANNCAAATMLALRALAAGKEVVVSRGELIEIGGSYRLPEVFAESGAILREVGATNRTRAADYAKAIGPSTAGLMKVHPSNYRIVGFAESATTRELADLAHQHGLWLIDDLGSGCLADLASRGLPAEPTVAASLSAGADLALFSGDKLLGGPQCGVAVGRRSLVRSLESHPLARALRVDKLTLAALQGTLETYLRDDPWQAIPVLRMLASTAEDLAPAAEELARAAAAAGWRASALPGVSLVGGGSLPACERPTRLASLDPHPWPAHRLAAALRRQRVVPRVADGRVLLDPRTIAPEEIPVVAAAFADARHLLQAADDLDD